MACSQEIELRKCESEDQVKQEISKSLKNTYTNMENCLVY